MINEPENPPAFPTEMVNTFHGMTLRDYFAAAALQGLMAACAGDSMGWYNAEQAGNAAYEYADAMLKARNDTK